MKNPEDRPDLVDTLLRERAGTHAQPDLTDAVLARLQRGEAAVQAGRLRWEHAKFPRRTRAWLAAAVLLLGLGVVAAVAFTRGEQEAVAVEPVEPETKGQDPVRQEPEPAPPPTTQFRSFFQLNVVGPLGEPVTVYEFDLLRVLSRQPLTYERVSSHRAAFTEAPPSANPGADRVPPAREALPQTQIVVGDPADGDYVVVVTAEGFAKTMSSPFAVAKGKQQAHVHVRMSAGVAFELHVAMVGGKPIAGVVVTTEPSRADLGSRTADGKVLLSIGDMFRPNLLSSLRAESNPSGTVSFRRVTPGTYRLVFRHPNYCTTVLDPVEVPLREPHEPVRMIPGAVVRGTVKGRAEAMAGAKVTLIPKADTVPNAGLWPMVTIANAKGEFAFDSRIPAGEYFVTPERQPATEHLLVDERGVMRDSVEVVVEEGTDVLEVALLCGADSSSSQQPAPDAKEPVEQDPAKDLPVAFTLRVVGPDGAPVPRMAVHLLSSLGTKPQRYSTLYVHDELHDRTGTLFAIHDIAVRQTNAEEREFRCRLNPHSYVVAVESEGYAKTVSRPFTVQKGMPAPLVDVVMNPGVEMRLQIASEHGKPIRGAVVTTVQPPPGALEVHLTPRIKDSADLLSEVRAESDGSGTLVLRHMAEGCYTLRVEHPDFCSVELEPVLVPLQQPIDVVRMVRGTRIRGTVRGANGVVANETVTLAPRHPARLTRGLRVPSPIPVVSLPSTGWSAMLAETDANGNFAFPHRVPAGTYVLTTPMMISVTGDAPTGSEPVEPEWIDVVVEAGREEQVVEWKMRDR